MGAVLALGSKVARGALIGNSALLHDKTKTEPNGIYTGVPAKYVRDMDPDSPVRVAIDVYIDSYIENTQSYSKNLKKLRD